MYTFCVCVSNFPVSVHLLTYKNMIATPGYTHRLATANKGLWKLKDALIINLLMCDLYFLYKVKLRHIEIETNFSTVRVGKRERDIEREK